MVQDLNQGETKIVKSIFTNMYYHDYLDLLYLFTKFYANKNKLIIKIFLLEEKLKKYFVKSYFLSYIFSENHGRHYKSGLRGWIQC